MKNLSIEALPRVPVVASPEQYAEARKRSWVATSDRGFEVLTHDHSRFIMTSREFDIGGGFGAILDMVGITECPYRDEWDKQLVCTEGEVRDHKRKPFARLLNVKQVNGLKNLIIELIHGILDDIKDPTNVDFMAEIATQLPTQLYCELISAPREMAAEILHITESINPPILNLDSSRVKESEEAYWKGMEFLGKHIEARRGNPGDDFTSELIRCEHEGLMAPDETTAAAMALLMASMDNTMHQLGLSFGVLLEDRSRWETVLANPEQYAQATEETFRLCPRFGVIARHASKDITVDNFTFPANSWIWMSTRSIGHDENKYERSQEFRLDRPDLRSLQFGGSHYSCLGASLARLEIREMIRIITERFPNIRMRGDWKIDIGAMTTECKQLRVSLV